MKNFRLLQFSSPPSSPWECYELLHSLTFVSDATDPLDESRMHTRKPAGLSNNSVTSLIHSPYSFTPKKTSTHIIFHPRGTFSNGSPSPSQTRITHKVSREKNITTVRGAPTVMDSNSMEQWRRWFISSSSSSDIFEVIENAITIAALDYPDEFRIRRDRIVEKLFLCQMNLCNGCDGVVLKGGDVEALTTEIEQANQIKELLSDCDDQCEDVVMGLLQRLQLMSLSLDTLQETKIGMTVKLLRKHRSKCVSNLAGTLIKDWKDLVNKWCSVEPNTKGEEGSPDSVNPSVVEEGLPFPPLDEGALFATQTGSIELSRGMDDDGNLNNCGEHNTNYENERKPAMQNQRVPVREIQPPREVNFGAMKGRGQDLSEDSVKKQIKVSNINSGSARPPKPISRNNLNDEMKLRRELATVNTQKMSFSGPHDKSKGLSKVDDLKLEAAKRKLHNGYQQAENAKKQRTVQVMEFHEIPKRIIVPVSSRMRPGSHCHNS